MEWIKIEKKWTEMARRLQGTATVARNDKVGGAKPGGQEASPSDISVTAETGALEVAVRAMV